MKAGWLAAAALAVPAFAQAAEWGLGTTVGNGGGTLYVPIKLSDTLRLEPFGGYLNYDVDNNGSSLVPVGFEQIDVGLGLFRTVGLGEHAQTYCGARAGYSRRAYDDATIGSDDGYSIEPTIGGEFFLAPQLSLGVEGYAFYGTLDSGGYDAKTIGTGSRFVARFFFQ